MNTTEIQRRFKTLTEDTIRNHTDVGSFSKGQSYFRNGYIVGPVLRGSNLRAMSMGHSGGPYKVEVTLAPVDEPQPGPITSYSCSCPRGGFCKHIVALLLLWIHSLEEIEVRADIATLLKDRSREELLAIITELLKREPELDEWVEIALSTSASAPGSAGKLSVNLSTIKRQVSSVFSQRSYEWGEASEIADKLSNLVEMGDRYADAGQWANAQVVYIAVVEQSIEHYDEVQDEDGDLNVVITDCGQGLARCLDAQPDLETADRLSPETRISILKTLYDIWEHDRNYGSWEGEESLPEFIARVADADERAQIEGWLRATLKKDNGSEYHEKWDRGPRVHFLLALRERDGLSDEDILAEYRQAELYEDLAERLLEMGRIDDAFAVARKRLDATHEVTNFADKVLRLDDQWRGKALTFVEDKLWEEKEKRNSDAYLGWLEDKYLKYSMVDKAFDAAHRRFKISPSDHTYGSVKLAANLPGQPEGLWDRTRPTLISTLEAKGDWGDLINIYLSEELVSDALAALAKLEAGPRHSSWSRGYQYYDTGLADAQNRVAKAAERDYPGEARAIYQHLAERYIEVRGRDSYQRAAEALARVKVLYAKQGLDDEWKAYITNLRTQNKSLRALKEEFDRRGLV